MITLVLTGLLLYLCGLPRTLAIYLGIALTIGTVILQMVCGAGFSFLFWPEWMRTFQTGEFWTNEFTERPEFKLWEAPAIPVIFVLDLFRIAFRLVTTRLTIFTVGFFTFWLYCMYLMWGMIFVLLLKRSKG